MELHSDVNYIMLVSDSIVCGLSVYLTYTTFKLLKTLKDNIYSYKFGSRGWWHWLEHTVATSLIFVGSAGRSIFKIMHTAEETISTVQNISVFQKTEIATDIFTAIIIIGLLIMINHIMSEEIIGGKFEHTPEDERRVRSSNKLNQHRRIGDVFGE